MGLVEVIFQFLPIIWTAKKRRLQPGKQEVPTFLISNQAI